jgi:hypothetical protein
VPPREFAGVWLSLLWDVARRPHGCLHGCTSCRGGGVGALWTIARGLCSCLPMHTHPTPCMGPCRASHQRCSRARRGPALNARCTCWLRHWRESPPSRSRGHVPCDLRCGACCAMVPAASALPCAWPCAARHPPRPALSILICTGISCKRSDHAIPLPCQHAWGRINRADAGCSRPHCSRVRFLS